MIKLIELLNGRMIVANIIDENDAELVLEKPLEIVMIPDVTGKRMDISWNEYNPLFKDKTKMTIRRDITVCAEIPNEQCADAYRRASGKLIIPQEKKLIGI